MTREYAALACDRALIWAALGLKLAGEGCFRLGDLVRNRALGLLAYLPDRVGCWLFERGYAIVIGVYARHDGPIEHVDGRRFFAATMTVIGFVAVTAAFWCSR